MSKEHLNRELLTQRILNNFEEDKYYFQKCDSYLDTDQLLVNVYFQINTVRNLDYKGLPYNA